MSYKVDRDLIKDAIYHNIVDWRERMIDAIRAVKPPQIGNEAPKAAAWVCFGFDAVNTLYPQLFPSRGSTSFPAALATGMLKRASLPIWALAQVQSAMASAYEAQIRQKQTELFSSYLDIRGEFEHRVQRITDGFMDSEFARALLPALQKHFSGWHFDDDLQADTKIKAFMGEAGLIEKHPNALRERVETGFGIVTRKIETIYKNSPDAPVPFLGQHGRLMYAPTTDMEWRETLDGEAYTGYKFYPVRNQDDALWIMANAYRMDVWENPRKYNPHMGSRLQPTTYVICRHPNRKPSDLLQTFDNPEQEISQALATAA